MFLLTQLQMQLHLFFEVRVELAPMHEHPQSSCAFAQPVHARTPFRHFNHTRDRANDATSRQPIVCGLLQSAGVTSAAVASRRAHSAVTHPLRSIRCNAGYSEPSSTWRTSSDIRWIELAISYPCISPERAKVLKISR
jgi:hypothetical protein